MGCMDKQIVMRKDRRPKEGKMKWVDEWVSREKDEYVKS